MGCASSAPRVGPPVGADGLPTDEADEFRPRKRSFLEPDQLDVTIVPEFSKNDEDDSFSTRMALFVLSMQT